VKSRLLRPLADGLDPLPPIALTAAGLVLGLAAAGLAATGHGAPALGLWLLNRLADGLDGELARRGDRCSDRGGYADLVADMVVYCAIPLGVAAGRGDRAAWIAAALLLASFSVNIVTVTHLAAILEKRSAGAAASGGATATVLPRGLVEGSETMVFLTVLVALPRFATATMLVMAAAVGVTAVGRFALAWPALGPEHDAAGGGLRAAAGR
jgi:phosphatidylglycerophosphate synthase